MDDVLKKTSRVFWLAMIAVLPITSMPLVARLLGSDSVASPAIIFMLGLVILWFIPAVFKGKKFSPQIFPLFLFCALALIATALSLFYQVPAFKGIDQFAPTISSIGTLAIGFMFFVVSSSYLESNEDLRLTMKVLNWSAFVMLVWCALQAYYWYGFNHYPQWMFNFQGLLSARVLYRQRLNGFALEPSWLAHQLNMLYLPVWLSCTMNRFSFHKFRLWKLTFENILLLGGMVAMFLSLSRVGFAAFFLMLAVVAIILQGHIVDAIQAFLQKKAKLKANPGKKWISALLILIYLLVISSVVYVYTRIDPRMENLFKFSFAQDNPLLKFFNELKFGDRVIYWLTGWNIFNDYPLLGVGLGNAGFYFTKYLPAYGWSLVEVENLLNRTTLLLNIKSLWLRLLAETGIIGFSIFIGWLLSFIPELVDKARSKKKEIVVLGLMGCLVLAALVFEGFSIDSFAMPYWWISLGLAANKIEKQAE